MAKLSRPSVPRVCLGQLRPQFLIAKAIEKSQLNSFLGLYSRESTNQCFEMGRCPNYFETELIYLALGGTAEATERA